MDELAICALVRNQAAYLHEWLSYHYAIGVRRFVLYDNASSDGTHAAVERWGRRDLVTWVDWPQPDSRLQAYADMAVRFRLAAEWCAFIDCDEFLVPQSSVSLTDILRAVGREANGLYVHWWMFGSSGHLSRQPGLVTETFRWRAPDGFPAHGFGKSIVRLGALTHVGLHVFRVAGRMVNDAGREIDQQSPGHQAQQSHTLLALNRYFVRSREEWRERRAPAGPADPGFAQAEAEFVQNDVNAVRDERAALFMQAARALFYWSAAASDTVRLPSPAALLTSHGTVLCWDGARQRVVHVAPHEAGAERVPLAVAFDEAGGPHGALSQPLDGEQRFALATAGLGPVLTLRGSGGFVSCAPGTDAVHGHAAAVGAAETFLPLALEDAARLVLLAPGGARLRPGFLLLLDTEAFDLRRSVPQRRLAEMAAAAANGSPASAAAPDPAPDDALRLYDLSVPHDQPLSAPIGPWLVQLRSAGRAEKLTIVSPAARLRRVAPFLAQRIGGATGPFGHLFTDPSYREYALHEVGCCALPEASLLAPDGLIWTGGALLRDSTRTLEPWRAEAWAAESVAGDADSLPLKRPLALPAVQPGHFFCGFVGAWRNYAHWITECLPRLVAYRTLRAGDPALRLVLPRLDRGSAQAQTLDLLGIAESEVVFLADGDGLAGRLCTLDAIDVWSVPTFCRQAALVLAEAVQRRLGPGSPSGFGSRLYIRRGTDTRRMLGLAALLPLLDRHGFRVVTMQDLGVAEQVRALRQASWIVGECGAALANVMFCEPGARVLELFNQGWTHPAHWTLASVCGLDYGFIEGRHMPSAEAPGPGHNADYLVTPEMLEPGLRALLANAGG